LSERGDVVLAGGFAGSFARGFMTTKQWRTNIPRCTRPIGARQIRRTVLRAQVYG